MEKKQAIELVRKTLAQPFEKDRFSRFVRELLHRFDPPPSQQMTVPDAFTNHVRSCQRLGTYRAPNGELLDILIVNVSEDYKIERTRTALRDFVAHKLKRGDNYKEAGLVAFVPPSGNNWRFSFVRMEYESVRDPVTGKIKAEERLTPARRYSYLVGVSERSHTAQKQLVPLLLDDTRDPELSTLEQAFGVEKVTKEFFSEYSRLFENTEKALSNLIKQDKTLRTEFENKHVSTVDFAKKLLGQIVFLYFIQKKGWLGVPKGGEWGEGPRDFLRQLANQAIAKNQSLFNDILEPLFYDTLATDRGHEAWCKTFQCRIPFLNGGLFEPLAGYDWENTEIHFPNSLFTNNELSSQGDTGTGILDVFDRYNFTVNEAEPLEKEVAIDPEMLGKVFENLIEENRRKGLGAFYTPREIVHYMCQESLINYLNTGLKGSIQRTDIEQWIHQSDQFAHYEAALASGTKRGVNYYQPPETIRQYAREIDDLLKDITVCDPAIGSGAFPVGMMTEVVRARTALTPYFNDIAERTAYHFKRHAIQNSLYGVDIDPSAVEIAKLRLWLSLVVDEEDLKQIKPLPNLDYKIVVGNSLLGIEKNLFNLQQFDQLEKLKPKYFDESDRKKKAQFKKQIDNLIHELTNGREVFDFEIYFSEIFHAKKGFDVVIANPPYEEISEKSQKQYYKKEYHNVLSGHYDLYIFFFRRAFEIGKDSSTVSFITPHTYLQYPQYQSLRSYLYNKGHIIEITSRLENVFETAVVDNALITLKSNISPTDNELTRFSEKKLENGVLINILSTSLPRTSFSDASFDLTLIENEKKIEKFLVDTEPLDNFVDSTQGIIVYDKSQGEMIDRFRDKKIDKTCKPVTRGREITKYGLNWSGRFICYGNWLCRSRDPKFFESPKIFLRQTADTLIGTYVAEPMYCIDSVHSLIAKGRHDNTVLLYILGILNSKLGEYIYRLLICETGKVFAQVKLTFLRKFPIKKAPPTNQLNIATVVDKILAAKKHNIEVDTRALESEIDLLIYKLYGLTKEEIEIVEGRVGG